MERMSSSSTILDSAMCLACLLHLALLFLLAYYSLDIREQVSSSLPCSF